MMSNEANLPAMTEEEIGALETNIYRRICAQQVTGDLAWWLANLYSQMLRLNNRIHELEQRNGSA